MILTPPPLSVFVKDDPDESDNTSYVASEDIIEVDNEALGTLEQTMEQ